MQNEKLIEWLFENDDKIQSVSIRFKDGSQWFADEHITNKIAVQANVYRHWIVVSGEGEQICDFGVERKKYPVLKISGAKNLNISVDGVEYMCLSTDQGIKVISMGRVFGHDFYSNYSSVMDDIAITMG